MARGALTLSMMVLALWHTIALQAPAETRYELSAAQVGTSVQRGGSHGGKNITENITITIDGSSTVPVGTVIAPFGKEDTARELQVHAARTQDTLVDAVENAEVAEIKRSVFRALTRLRAAEIKEFDPIARLETQAIDAYNDAHHYRAENPLAHLHEDEAPVETDKLKSPRCASQPC